ncbi:MAG: hypothetical protein ACI4V0_06025 [Lachnospiraceae bacterium]
MKLLRKTISSILTFSLALTMLFTINVQASERIPSMPSDFGEPIDVITYLEEDGSQITERIYFYPDTSSNTKSKSGTGWYKNEKTKTWTSGETTTYYAQGYFTWANGEVSVQSPSGSATEVSGVTLSNKSLTHGTGKYGYLFNNFAYVTYSFTATTDFGMSSDLSVTIRISESGNAI